MNLPIPPANRRDFLKAGAASVAASIFGTSCGGGSTDESAETASRYQISLAQWSLNKQLKAGELDNLDFVGYTKDKFGISAVEYVNQFFADKDPKLGLQPKSADYLAQMKQRAADAGVENVLIMCDGVGNLGNPDDPKRLAAIEGHYAWLECAKDFGCHSIRVNARSDAKLSPERQHDLCVDGLSRLSEKAKEYDLNVIVENHGGLSSSGTWLAGVLSAVGMDNCGSLPDFGNFYLARNRGDAERYTKEKAIYEGDPLYKEDEKGLYYDRYQGVKDLMPYAKGVSAKAHDFTAEGDEAHTDFVKMMQIVDQAGYSGYVGIEYEGKEMGADEGILATKALLEKAFAAVA